MRRFEDGIYEFQYALNNFKKTWDRECVRITDSKVAKISVATVRPISDSAKLVMQSAQDMRAALETLERLGIIGSDRRQ